SIDEKIFGRAGERRRGRREDQLFKIVDHLGVLDDLLLLLGPGYLVDLVDLLVDLVDLHHVDLHLLADLHDLVDLLFHLEERAHFRPPAPSSQRLRPEQLEHYQQQLVLVHLLDVHLDDYFEVQDSSKTSSKTSSYSSSSPQAVQALGPAVPGLVKVPIILVRNILIKLSSSLSSSNGRIRRLRLHHGLVKVSVQAGQPSAAGVKEQLVVDIVVASFLNQFLKAKDEVVVVVVAVVLAVLAVVNVLDVPDVQAVAVQDIGKQPAVPVQGDIVSGGGGASSSAGIGQIQQPPRLLAQLRHLIGHSSAACPAPSPSSSKGKQVAHCGKVKVERLLEQARVGPRTAPSASSAHAQSARTEAKSAAFAASSAVQRRVVTYFSEGTRQTGQIFDRRRHSSRQPAQKTWAHLFSSPKRRFEGRRFSRTRSKQMPHSFSRRFSPPWPFGPWPWAWAATSPK
ncbi:hypothetical protein TYRP_010493, partial [Tyrophagus putrescentiae]